MVVARAGLTHAAGRQALTPPLCHLIRRSRRARLAVAAVVVAVVRSSSHDHVCLTFESASSHFVCDYYTVARISSSHTLGHRLPSTNTSTSNRQATLPAPLRLRRPPASPPRSQPAVAVQQRRPEPTRSSQLCPEASSPTRRPTHETLASLAPHHILHTSIFTTTLSSFLSSLLLYHTLLITATPISPQTNPASP